MRSLLTPPHARPFSLHTNTPPPTPHHSVQEASPQVPPRCVGCDRGCSSSFVMGSKAPRLPFFLSPTSLPPKQTDKNRDDPKAADKFVLVNKAKTFLADDVSHASMMASLPFDSSFSSPSIHPPTHPPKRSRPGRPSARSWRRRSGGRRSATAATRSGEPRLSYVWTAIIFRLIDPTPNISQPPPSPPPTPST